MSNHSPFPDQEMFKHMNGPTGKFPEGKLTEKDEGELQFRIGAKNDKVILQFGSPVAWLGMTPEQAVNLAETLMQKAADLGHVRPVSVEIK